jgi:hypothetical protein
MGDARLCLKVGTWAEGTPAEFHAYQVSRDETAHLQQDLSKLLNLIKLSEFPYLRWSTFGHVVKSCLWQPSPAFEVCGHAITSARVNH